MDLFYIYFIFLNGLAHLCAYIPNRDKTILYNLNLIGIKVRDGMLKLANEVEPYKQYKMWGFNVIDIAHSVRRAQAINSEIKKWGLKYITKYLGKEKPNRVYVDGAFISKIYLENESFYVNPLDFDLQYLHSIVAKDIYHFNCNFCFTGCYLWFGRLEFKVTLALFSSK